MSTTVDSVDEVRAMVREFARAEIAPHARAWDEQSHCPVELLRRLGGLGMLGILFPEEFGGAGLSYRHYVAILEELAAVEAGVALSVAAHNSLCTNHIFMFGSDRQRSAWVPQLARGEMIGAWGLTEPEAGSDAGGTRTTATRDGDGWVLSGTKNFITHASVGGVAVVTARTTPGSDHHGISAFVIPLDAPGVVRGKKEDKVGMRVSDTASLILEECRVGADALLGREGDGFVQAMAVLDGGRISIAALAVGIARGAWEAALAYARERRQFGRPIAQFQATRFKLADMATEIEAARLLTYKAAWEKDEGRNFTLTAAQAKLKTGRLAGRASEEAVQIHGGYGYIEEYPVCRFYRDAKILMIGEGTDEVQQMVIARALGA